MNRIKTIGCLLSFTCSLLTSCIAPFKDFERYAPPTPPDYSKESNWASLPTKKDSADAVPYYSTLKDEQATAMVDVFFVYPTTYYSGSSWNADVDDRHVNRKTDKYPIREMASVFNGSCKVYAPRYRQATLYAFIDKKANGRKALDLAYEDVKAAFMYYLKNYNNGRPFIIASHSQGTWHAIRLFKDFIEKDAQLRQQLIAAYLIGGPVAKNGFTTISACDSAAQTNCYVAWHTMAWGKHPSNPSAARKKTAGYDNFLNYECTNPLTWNRDPSVPDASLNKGAVPYTFNRIDAGFSAAWCTSEGALWTHKPNKLGYPAVKNYHILDYSLFYVNIRENVKLRVDRYLSKR